MTVKIRNRSLNIIVACIAFTWVCSLFLFAGSIKVIYPNGGEILKMNTRVDITWQSQGVSGKVVIVLYKKGIKHRVLSPEADNNGKFTWQIPGDIPEGNDYRIRIRVLDNLAINDFSDRDFSIKK